MKPNPTKKAFTQAFAYLKAQGVTLKMIAEKVGISYTTIYNVSRGRSISTQGETIAEKMIEVWPHTKNYFGANATESVNDAYANCQRKLKEAEEEIKMLKQIIDNLKPG